MLHDTVPSYEVYVVVSSHGSALMQSQCVVREKCIENNVSGQKVTAARFTTSVSVFDC